MKEVFEKNNASSVSQKKNKLPPRTSSCNSPNWLHNLVTKKTDLQVRELRRDFYVTVVDAKDGDGAEPGCVWGLKRVET